MILFSEIQRPETGKSHCKLNADHSSPLLWIHMVESTTIILSFEGTFPG